MYFFSQMTLCSSVNQFQPLSISLKYHQSIATKFKIITTNKNAQQYCQLATTILNVVATTLTSRNDTKDYCNARNQWQHHSPHIATFFLQTVVITPTYCNKFSAIVMFSVALGSFPSSVSPSGQCCQSLDDSWRGHLPSYHIIIMMFLQVPVVGLKITVVVLLWDVWSSRYFTQPYHRSSSNVILAYHCPERVSKWPPEHQIITIFRLSHAQVSGVIFYYRHLLVALYYKEYVDSGS